jgi:hypothetical protein
MLMTHLAMNFSFAALSHFNWASIATAFTTMGHAAMHVMDGSQVIWK